MEKTRYLSVESGGTRGFLYMGALDALERWMLSTTGVSYEEWRQGLLGVSGTSAGAIAALVVALGLSCEDRTELLSQIADLKAVLQRPDVTLLMHRFGWEDGRSFKEFVQNVLMRGGLSAESTLGDLKRLLRIEFVCFATELNTGHAFELSSTRTPTIRMCDAIYASCCVPFVFTPQPYEDGRMLVDGCLSCVLPRVFPEAETTFVTLSSEPPMGVRTWVEYLNGIVRCACVCQEEELCRLRARVPETCVTLPVSRHIGTCTRSFDVDLHTGDLDVFHRCGYNHMLDHLLRGVLTKTVNLAVSVYVTNTTVHPDGPEANLDERPPPTSEYEGEG